MPCDLSEIMLPFDPNRPRHPLRDRSNLKQPTLQEVMEILDELASRVEEIEKRT